MAFPAWIAVISVVPAPFIVTLFSIIVATAVLELMKDTGKLEVELADKMNGSSSLSLSGIRSNVIVWATWSIWPSQSLSLPFGCF